MSTEPTAAGPETVTAGVKTIREWLETLPDGYRERAIAAREGKAGRVGITWAPTLDEAVLYGFWHDETEEGTGFWDAVWRWARVPEERLLPALSSQPTPSETESLKQRIAELEGALVFYADTSKYPAPKTGGMGELYFDCGSVARKALAGKDSPKVDPQPS